MSSLAANHALLSEAADWLIVLHYEKPSEEDHAAFELWRQQSPAHEEAWNRAKSMLGTFAQVPPEVCKQALVALPRSDRRKTLAVLGAFLFAAPVSWLAWRELSWREWMADEMTARGEQRSIVLPDGSKLTLNTASAVMIRFTSSERRIRLLQGEVLITTHSDPSPAYRPFLVQSRQGTVQALGTKFSVRRIDASITRVSVFAHAVNVKTSQGATRLLHEGSFADFNADDVTSPSVLESSAAYWERGILLAKNMRLADVVAEMARYRSDVLQCSSGIGDLRISGTLSLKDTDASLDLLAQSLPVRIDRQVGGTVTVLPR